MYNKGYHIIISSKCIIENVTSKEMMFIASQNKDVYVINIEFESEVKYLSNLKDDSWLWHRILDHVSMDLRSKKFQKLFC